MGGWGEAIATSSTRCSPPPSRPSFALTCLRLCHAPGLPTPPLPSPAHLPQRADSHQALRRAAAVLDCVDDQRQDLGHVGAQLRAGHCRQLTHGGQHSHLKAVLCKRGGGPSNLRGWQGKQKRKLCSVLPADNHCCPWERPCPAHPLPIPLTLRGALGRRRLGQRGGRGRCGCAGAGRPQLAHQGPQHRGGVGQHQLGGGADQHAQQPRALCWCGVKGGARRSERRHSRLRVVSGSDGPAVHRLMAQPTPATKHTQRTHPLAAASLASGPCR